MARQLIELGFDAVALEGGYKAWRERFPVEAKGDETGETRQETGETRQETRETRQDFGDA